MKRLALTRHTVRCPLEDCAASVTVRTDPDGSPSRRHVDVATCSHFPSTAFVAPGRRGYLSDVAPLASYLCEAGSAPHHPADVACRKACLAILNAAERGAAPPVRCTSAVADAVELAAQVERPPVTRLMWYYGA